VSGCLAFLILDFPFLFPFLDSVDGRSIVDVDGSIESMIDSTVEHFRFLKEIEYVIEIESERVRESESESGSESERVSESAIEIARIGNFSCQYHHDDYDEDCYAMMIVISISIASENEIVNMIDHAC
jgi:hypothetical protein